jgi:hypothetical protein
MELMARLKVKNRKKLKVFFFFFFSNSFSLVPLEFHTQSPHELCAVDGIWFRRRLLNGCSLGFKDGYWLAADEVSVSAKPSVPGHASAQQTISHPSVV